MAGVNRRVVGLLFAATALAGCASLPPPSQTQKEEALAFAVAHAELPEAPMPPVRLASRDWMANRIGASYSEQVRGLYLFSCRCIYLDEQSWTMPILVHEMVHYLEHMAGMPPSHRRADPVGELYAELAE